MNNEHHIHVYLHLPGVREFEREVLAKLDLILTKENKVMAELDDLEAAVKANDDAEDSALALIQGIAARIDAAIAASGGMSAADKARLVAVSTDIKSRADALSAAVVANTPAATPPAP